MKLQRTLPVYREKSMWCKILADENLGSMFIQNNMAVAETFKIILQS
jgi:hypothetical protein